MRRPRALVLPTLPECALVRLSEIAELAEVPPRPSLGFSDEQLADLVIETGASVIVTEGDQVRDSVLSLPLDIVACLGPPTNVDLRLAAACGVAVLHPAGRDPDAVAELAIALLFAVSRHVVVADREVRRGRVYRGRVPPSERHRGIRLAGRTLGLVGLGQVGRAVRWRARGLGMNVVAHDPHVAEATLALPELLAVADVVSLHVPVTEDTRAFMGAVEFAAMRAGAIYLNTARGALHDLAALVDALRRGHLGGAGLDHFEGEWLDPTHPLTRLPNVVLTPNLGHATGESQAEHARSLVEDIGRTLRGEAPAHACQPVMRVGESL